MSGQLNVEDNTIAAAANASAPNRNNPRSSAEAHGRCLPMSYPAAQRRDQHPLRCSEVRRFELSCQQPRPRRCKRRGAVVTRWRFARSATRSAGSSSDQPDRWLGSKFG
jgi:hypothetical protein